MLQQSPWAGTGPELIVGDDLQPSRYRAVLEDVARHLAATGRGSDVRGAARRLLLHSDGLAERALTAASSGTRWVIDRGRSRVELSGEVDPFTLIAACLRTCPAGGRVRLRRDGADTGIGTRWPFTVDDAVALTTQAGTAASSRA